MPRDKNDGRVTFTTLALKWGLTHEQAKALWQTIHAPYPDIKAEDYGNQ